MVQSGNSVSMSMPFSPNSENDAIASDKMNVEKVRKQLKSTSSGDGDSESDSDDDLIISLNESQKEKRADLPIDMDAELLRYDYEEFSLMSARLKSTSFQKRSFHFCFLVSSLPVFNN